VDHFGQALYDLSRLAPQNPGLCLSINKELIDKTKSRESDNIVKDNRIIGLGNQRTHMLESHWFLYMDILTPMGFKKRM
jgi:hypothetical protein